MHKWTRRDWWEAGTFYGFFLGVTGVACVALSLYLRSLDLLLGWVYFAVGFTVLCGAALLMRTVTVWPIALLLGWLFRGNQGAAANRDPEGPGFIV